MREEHKDLKSFIFKARGPTKTMFLFNHTEQTMVVTLA